GGLIARPFWFLPKLFTSGQLPRHKWVVRHDISERHVGGLCDSNSLRSEHPRRKHPIAGNVKIGAGIGQIFAIVPLASDSESCRESTGTGCKPASIGSLFNPPQLEHLSNSFERLERAKQNSAWNSIGQ